MNNLIQIKDMFSNIPNNYFWILVGLFTLIIRLILSFFKALAINNGEVDDPKNDKVNKDKSGECENEWKGCGFKKAFIRSFFSNGKDIKIDDYFIPALIGYFELIIYPILMSKNLIEVIGAWIAIKTASSWGGWQKTRTAYNRFLLGNILSLIASYFICKIYNL